MRDNSKLYLPPERQIQNRFDASKDIRRRIQLLETKEGTGGGTSGSTDSGWQPLAFNTGWQDFSATTYNTGAYRKIGDFIYLKGLVNRVSGTLTTIATLPIGFRPIKRHVLPVKFNNSTTGSARLDVTAIGNIVFFSLSAFDFISLDGIVLAATE